MILWSDGKQKRYRLFPHLFRKKVENQCKLKKTEKSRTSSSISAEMTGDSCMARAVVPRTAAAVDHADTELIGHDGQLGDTGFLCSGFKEMISRLCAYFPLPKEWQQAQ